MKFFLLTLFVIFSNFAAEYNNVPFEEQAISLMKALRKARIVITPNAQFLQYPHFKNTKLPLYSTTLQESNELLTNFLNTEANKLSSLYNEMANQLEKYTKFLQCSDLPKALGEIQEEKKLLEQINLIPDANAAYQHIKKISRLMSIQYYYEQVVPKLVFDEHRAIFKKNRSAFITAFRTQDINAFAEYLRSDLTFEDIDIIRYNQLQGVDKSTNNINNNQP